MLLPQPPPLMICRSDWPRKRLVVHFQKVPDISLSRTADRRQKTRQQGRSAVTVMIRSVSLASPLASHIKRTAGPGASRCRYRSNSKPRNREKIGRCYLGGTGQFIKIGDAVFEQRHWHKAERQRGISWTRGCDATRRRAELWQLMPQRPCRTNAVSGNTNPAMCYGIPDHRGLRSCTRDPTPIRGTADRQGGPRDS